ncbi:hypothetical protein ALP18_200350 [Pseudomonas amygdali pv. myricae]|nr:ISPssy [Pseudomonas amygdali pv. myricae]RMV04909.1 hypothetical protein ALP18_200350 [Pseudomonas amygdali pv. myricae]
MAGGILQVINGYLGDRGLMLRQGTVVDATIIHAPSSTKNKDGKRDPEMHQTKKGNQYFFGMKAHIGVDAESGLVHSLVGTATVFRTYLAAQSSRFRLGGVAAGKQLFGVNPHQYWLPAHDGDFWNSGLQPQKLGAVHRRRRHESEGVLRGRLRSSPISQWGTLKLQRMAVLECQ